MTVRIFDEANQSKSAQWIRGLTAFIVGLLFIAGSVWADHIGLALLLWKHWGWALLAMLTLLVLFPIAAYVGLVSVLTGRFGFWGFLLGAMMVVIVLLARSLAYCFVRYGHRKLNQHWRPGESGIDAAYEGLIGGSPTRKTGFWSLGIRMGGSSGDGSGGSKGGGRFGGGGASGRY